MSEIQPYGPQGSHLAPAPHQHRAAYQPVMTDQRPVDGAVQAVAWVLAVLTLGYLLPWAIATTRGRPNHGAIALINLLLGWSLIGWIVALVMACQSHQVVGQAPVTTFVVAQQFPNAHFAGSPPPVTTAPPAGWYPSPSGQGQQYWDGAAWTGHTAP